MKKILFILALVALIVITSCGGGQSTDSNDTTDTVSSNAARIAELEAQSAALMDRIQQMGQQYMMENADYAAFIAQYNAFLNEPADTNAAQWKAQRDEFDRQLDNYMMELDKYTQAETDQLTAIENEIDSLRAL